MACRKPCIFQLSKDIELWRKKIQHLPSDDCFLILLVAIVYFYAMYMDKLLLEV
jgi:hypothetical protein